MANKGVFVFILSIVVCTVLQTTEGRDSFVSISPVQPITNILDIVPIAPSVQISEELKLGEHNYILRSQECIYLCYAGCEKLKSWRKAGCRVGCFFNREC
ncbi:hypothetical protein FRX31_032090 [Thalictrum thalictroides]|uniref:Uncharacterized protein n=1 Tax=Thalictrum thalictroides TaxID=46969 RepID=A0A7J6V0A4_THATH|nr:hypothetical protein FRX31_032090 [Thalictrum thalictroides]